MSVEHALRKKWPWNVEAGQSQDFLNHLMSLSDSTHLYGALIKKTTYINELALIIVTCEIDLSKKSTI